MTHPRATLPVKVSILLAEWFGVGRLPAPGTMGTVACLPILWLLQWHLGQSGLWIFTIMVSIIGLVVIQVYQRVLETHDAGEIVIDEVAGMALCACFLPAGLVAFALGFVLFRLCDIFKPYPINLIDRYMHSSLGVMLDDLLAGLYAAGLSNVFWHFLQQYL